MKAFLLAAGYGTRLRPLTDTIPKCMVPIKGLPLLGWWFKLLQSHRVTKVLVNTHYLPDLVRGYIISCNQENTGLTACEFYEPELLGSGGTVKANRDFVGSGEDFIICYADNLTNINLSAMMNYHKTHDGILTMALFRTNKPEQCGIATLNDEGYIIDFVEKPAHPQSNLANAGVYIAKRNLFDYFPDSIFIDFGKDVLPKLIGKMYGWEIGDYLIDIGTLENYERAQREWEYDYL